LHPGLERLSSNREAITEGDGGVQGLEGNYATLKALDLIYTASSPGSFLFKQSLELETELNINPTFLQPTG